MTKELIVATNPARKRRTAAQKAATRKLVALNRRRSRGGSKRRNPAPKRRAKSRRRTTRRTYARKRNPAPRLPTMRGLLNRQVMPALVGGGGAVLNDIAYGFLPLPAELQTGTFRHVGKAASAILLGYISSFVVGKKTGDTIAAGALTVVGYNVVRDLVQRFAPNMNMGYYLEPGLSYPGAGWNPTYGGVDNTLNMGALLPRMSGGGGAGVPGAGVTIPSQLDPQAYGGMGSYHDGYE